MSLSVKKSRNNRRKTAGKFITNPTQYMPLCNPAKYRLMYDTSTRLITVKYIKDVSVFDYSELCRYLDANSIKLEAVIIDIKFIFLLNMPINNTSFYIITNSDLFVYQYVFYCYDFIHNC